MRRTLLILAMALPALGQHDISKVDPTPPDAAISTPTPDSRRMKKYDIPDLAGAQQALGSQLIDGQLPKPLIDFITQEGPVEQRVSVFEGGLVVINMTGASTIRKKLLIPPDALKAYTGAINAKALHSIDARNLSPAEPTRRAQLRVYETDGTYVERIFIREKSCPSRSPIRPRRCAICCGRSPRIGRSRAASRDMSRGRATSWSPTTTRSFASCASSISWSS